MPTPRPRRPNAVDAASREFAEAQPLQRAGHPKDIARTALALASDAAAFVTGQAIVVDGGLLAGRKWSDQPDFFRRSRPITVYRPEGR